MFHRFRFQCAALFLAMLAAGAAPVAAGEWKELPGDGADGSCRFLFTGEIMGGDLTKALDSGWLTGFPPRVCLDSPGGSLAEVYRFLRRIDEMAAKGNDVLFSTMIRTGDVCLSSCAILFMFGQSFGANSPYPDRRMEPGARLGFHSPFIPPSRTAGIDGSEAFRVALDVAKLLADRSYTAITADGPALPPELLSLVLGTPASEMRYVDMIGEMRLLGIEMTRRLEDEAAFPATRESVEQVLKRICISSYVLTYRQHMVKDGYRFADLVAFVEGASRYEDATRFEHLVQEKQEYGAGDRIIGVLTGPYHVPGWFSAGAAMYCRVEIGYKPDGDMFRVPYYNVDFGLLTQNDLTTIPERTGDVRVTTGGLLPIETRYGG